MIKRVYFRVTVTGGAKFFTVYKYSGGKNYKNN